VKSSDSHFVSANVISPRGNRLSRQGERTTFLAAWLRPRILPVLSSDETLRELLAYIDERWRVAHPRSYREITGGWRLRPDGGLALLCQREASNFLVSVSDHDRESALFRVDDDGRYRSDRMPLNAGGTPKGYRFFEEGGTVRLETIVHMAAVVRLQSDFGWPRNYLAIESPDVGPTETAAQFGREALDVLALEEPAITLRSKMTPTEARSRVGVEVKAKANELASLLRKMQACPGETGAGHSNTEHRKCSALSVFRPRHFLGIAAGEVWRLFDVVRRDNRYVVGRELPNLDCLHFDWSGP